MAKVLRQEGMASFATIIGETALRGQNLEPNDIEQIVTAVAPVEEGSRPSRGAVIYTLTAEASTDVAGLAKVLASGDTTESTHNGRSILLTRRGAIWVIDNRSVVVGPQNDVKWLIDSQSDDGQEPEWLASAKALADMDAVFAIDGKQLAMQMSKMPGGPTNPALAFAPLWEETRSLVGGASIIGGLSYRLTARCEDENGAEKVLNTLQSLIPLGKNMLDGAKSSLERMPPEAKETQAMLVGVAEDLLSNLETKQNGVEVTVTTSTENDVAKTIVALLMPAVMQAREAARRSQGKNNLKQLGIAFHNYHVTHGHFPNEKNVGPDGKTVHSWRVALLPFLNETQLYEQYNLDEPWDSENNKKVLAQMPKAFRNPNATGNEPHTSCFVLTGADTAAGDGSKKLHYRDMTDGTSNILHAVEAVREVPWTKPEDIVYDPEKEIPELGGFHRGGYHAVFCDGAVRFISERIDEKTLRYLITRNDGNTVGAF